MAQQLIQLPRSLGDHPGDGEAISTGLGRYGPFLKHGSEYRNLESWQKACALTFEEALEILKEPKKTGRRFGAQKKVIKEIGDLPDAAAKCRSWTVATDPT